jgi:hypothetical protein
MDRRGMKGGAMLPREVVEKDEPERKKTPADCNLSSRLCVPIG